MGYFLSWITPFLGVMKSTILCSPDKIILFSNTNCRKPALVLSSYYIAWLIAWIFFLTVVILITNTNIYDDYVHITSTRLHVFSRKRFSWNSQNSVSIENRQVQYDLDPEQYLRLERHPAQSSGLCHVGLYMIIKNIAVTRSEKLCKSEPSQVKYSIYIYIVSYTSSLLLRCKKLF